MDALIALDIETTGLDPEKDRIIEIGAVRFTDRRVEAEWSTLVNPGRPIPPFITQLTGITDQMVLHAPPIKAVLPELIDFVGDEPVVGHNVGFDLSFLRRIGILAGNEAIDTYEMAAVLLPGAPRYSLSALTQALGVMLPASHRALDDAHATRGVYLRLAEEAQRLPISLLAEIVRLAEPLDWAGYRPFRQALGARTREVVHPDQVKYSYKGPLFTEVVDHNQRPLQPRDPPQALNTGEICALLEHGGAFSRHFPLYEYRPQQVGMLQAVTEALSQGQHLMVEAGTGTGKSIAYLVPAALWSMQNDSRVVISTNTINLQDQLINKDIPDTRQALGIDLRAVVLKGRANYLCPRRLESLRRRGPTTVDELRVLSKVLVWLQGTASGDRAELNLNTNEERQVWLRLSAEDEACTSETCVRRMGGICPFYRIRQAANSAHLVVVNHALLLADVATGSRVLPEYEYLVVDEAHHLEDATTNALSYRTTQTDIERLLRELGGPRSGLLGWILSAAQPILPPDDLASLDYLVQRATDLAFRLENEFRRFFTEIDRCLYNLRDGRPVGLYSHQERILPATRTQPAWGSVEMVWEDAQSSLQALLDTLNRLVQAVAEILQSLSEEDQELYGSLGNLYRRFAELHQNLHALVFEPDPGRIYWAEVHPNNGRIALNNAPLHIGPLMQKHLWHEKTAVILTSATLTAGGEFTYLRGRLAADEAGELALGSPFDYENAALIYIANDIPEPNDRHAYQRAVESGLINLCRATGGRALVLFTSYEQLKRTSQSIAPLLANHGILVFEQGEGASPHSLLESFRSAERAVLLGTRAFWEGVDVPGAALSVLVIVKLPFDVPTDPIVAARAETFEDPFNEYSLPEAILRFRQGFGRLIRTQSDRGIVAILDRRVLSKRYGRLFIDSLPACTLRMGPLADLPRTATRWLNT